MDKETLSNYGWIVICVLVLAVMIALATPFGNYVKTGVENTATGLVETSNKGIDIALLSTGTPKPYVPIVRNGIIPDGATYTPNGGTAILGNGTNTFPDTPQTGDTYEEGDYIYIYNQYCVYGNSWSTNESQNGWGVGVKDDSKTSYGVIISEIAEKFVTNMSGTFNGCSSLTAAPTIPNSVTDMIETFAGTSLTTAPVIPSSVTNMSYTFYFCTSLTTAPAIPSSVINMDATFSSCTSLAGTIEVNANPTSYDGCLGNTQITGITGSCSQEMKDALMATK